MDISFSNGGTREPHTEGAARAMTRTSSVVVMLGVVSIFTNISSESVAAVLPIYLTSALGLTTIAFGLINGLYQSVTTLARVGTAGASQRLDRPKWMAFLGYGVSAAAKVWLLFATAFAALAAIVVIDRLGKGIRIAPRDALLSATSAPPGLARSFGVHRMLDTIGAAVGPLIAFLILTAVPNGYSTVFVVSLIFAILGVILLGLLVPNKWPRKERVGQSRPRMPFVWRRLNEPRLRRLAIAASILGLLTIGDGFIYLVLQSRSSFAFQWFPLLYVGTHVLFLLFAVPLGHLADRFGRERVFIIGHLALLAAYACTALPFGGTIVIVVCLVLLGAFYAATDGVLAAMAAEFSPLPSAASGAASGPAAVQSVVAVARLVASIMFGLLWFAVGRVDAMLIVASALAVAVPVVIVLLRPILSQARTA